MQTGIDSLKPSGLKGDRRAGLSCAECRRSKLRCDRTFPCQACIRRGCAAICPDGTLAATKGNKILQNQNQNLTQQVKAMSTRISELEVALRNLQAESSTQPHPLLEGNSISQSIASLNSEYQGARLGEASDALGSLSLGELGESRYHGETASSEYLASLLPTDESPEFYHPLAANLNFLGLPWQILELVNAFPLGTAVQSEITKTLFGHFLPPRDKALKLTSLYYEFAGWMYDPIPQHDFHSNVLNKLYGSIPSTSDAFWDRLHCHQLSVFFMIMAIGTLYDDENTSAATFSDRYHALGCAALSLSPIGKEATCWTIQALFLEVFFLFQSDRMSGERRWLLTGLASRLGHSIGLQRDSASWNVPPEETQRRRVMYWELFTWDSYTSVIFGRPPAMSIDYTDCRFPEDIDPTTKPNGTTELGWHAWKYRNSAACFAPSVQHVFSTKAGDYSALMELDRRIRKFPVPQSLQAPTHGTGEPVDGKSWSSDPTRALMQYCTLAVRETNLLYIHRSYFAQAIKKDPANPLNNKHGASVMAVYRSASLLVSGLRSLYGRHPKHSSRVWFYWSGVFSACIVLGALVIESPGCKLSANALMELDYAISLYKEGSQLVRPPATVGALNDLQQRAQRAYAYFFAGKSAAPVNHPVAVEKKDRADPLLVALGGTALVKAPSKSPSSSSSPAAHMGSPGSDDMSRQQSPSGVHLHHDINARPQQHYSGRDEGFDSSQLPDPRVHGITEFGQSLASAPLFYEQSSLGISFDLSPESDQDQLVPMDFAEPTQEEIWQNFLTELGIENR